jgi:hypothetical protein
MNRLLFLLCLVLILGISGCGTHRTGDFAIYLLAADISSAEAAKTDLNALTPQNQPIITSADLVSYDKDSHEIVLTQAAFQRIQRLFPTPVRVDGIPFIVCVGDERIYTGAFWTPLSSLSYDGVIILQPFDTKNPRIQISLGYPSPEAFTGVDPRADTRVLGALERAGKLK